MNRPEYLTTQEVADLLRLPVATLRAWRHRNVGPPAFRMGKHLRYDLAQVLLWVNQRQEEELDRAASTGRAKVIR
jgi:excisionase family DNA binding protein